MGLGFPFTDDHVRVVAILSLCIIGSQTKQADALRAMFEGCTAVGRDLYWLVRKKNGTHLHDTAFARALRAQQELDDEDAQITKSVLSHPSVKMGLNPVGKYWANKLGQFPADQRPHFVIDPYRKPKPVWGEMVRTPTKLVCMLSLFTKFLKSQVAEQIRNRIPNCSVDDRGVIQVLFRKAHGAQLGSRLIDRPFYKSMEAKEDLSLEESKLAWMVVRSGHFALPHELSEIGQHYYNTLYNFPEEAEWKEASLPSLAMAEILEIAASEFQWGDTSLETPDWTEPPIEGVVIGPPAPPPHRFPIPEPRVASPSSPILIDGSPIPSPTGLVDTAMITLPEQQVALVQPQEQRLVDWQDMSRQMVTGAEPIIAMTEGLLRAFGEGRLTYAELIAASQHAKLYGSHPPSSGMQDSTAVPTLTSAVEIPELFSDVFNPQGYVDSQWMLDAVPISEFQPADPQHFEPDSLYPPVCVPQIQPVGWGMDRPFEDFPPAPPGPSGSRSTSVVRSNRPSSRREPYSRR